MIIINTDSVSSIVGAIIILAFALYFFTSYLIVRKERLHFVISVTLFCFFLYLISYSLYSSARVPETVLFWTRACYGAGVLIIYASYQLSSEIVHKESPFLKYPGCQHLLFRFYSAFVIGLPFRQPGMSPQKKCPVSVYWLKNILQPYTRTGIIIRIEPY